MYKLEYPETDYWPLTLNYTKHVVTASAGTTK